MKATRSLITRILVVTILFSTVFGKRHWSVNKRLTIIKPGNIINGIFKAPIFYSPGALEKEFLAAHNGIRRSKGEPPLKWDKGLATVARRWAKRLKRECKMEHSNGPYGENLFWGSSDKWTPTQAVQAWIDEKKDYDEVKNSCKARKECGHYTQVVWKNTLRVGCARQKCKSGDLLMVCNYDPPGNYVNENPFGGSA